MIELLSDSLERTPLPGARALHLPRRFQRQADHGNLPALVPLLGLRDGFGHAGPGCRAVCQLQETAVEQERPEEQEGSQDQNLNLTIIILRLFLVFMLFDGNKIQSHFRPTDQN